MLIKDLMISDSCLTEKDKKLLRDNPGLQYYPIDVLHANLPQKTAYQYVYDNNINRKTNVAMDFAGKKITYDEFDDKIGDVSKAFKGIDLNPGDRVMILMPNIPETAYIQYGLNKLGVTADFIDPLSKPETVFEFLKREKSKAIVCLDLLYKNAIKPVENKIKEELNIDKVISVSVTESMPFILKSILKGKDLVDFIKNKETKVQSDVFDVINWNNFVKNGKNEIVTPRKYVEDNISLITHTSGTTDIPKPIPISDDNMNAMAFQHQIADFGFNPGLKFLHILPYFAAYGAVTSAHLGFSMGMEMLEVPQFNIADFSVLLNKYKPNIVMGTPSWWKMLISDPRIKNADFSFLTCAVAGGESFDEKTEEQINTFFKKHNCNIQITKGHGMSELSGSGSCSSAGPNVLGDYGIPLPLTSYVIVEPGTTNRVSADENGKYVGEALINTPSMTSGVLDGKIIVPKVYIDNIPYIKTGDIISMDAKTGSMRFEERADRAFTRYDGYKIHPIDIERIIMSNENVKDCLIVQYEDEARCGKMPIAHIVLNENCSDDKEQIIEEILSEISSRKDLTVRDIPAKWLFRENIPLTKMSKKDYKKLILDGLSGDEYTINFEETNMKVSDYQIEKPESLKKNR